MPHPRAHRARRSIASIASIASLASLVMGGAAIVLGASGCATAVDDGFVGSSVDGGRDTRGSFNDAELDSTLPGADARTDSGLGEDTHGGLDTADPGTDTGGSGTDTDPGIDTAIDDTYVEPPDTYVPPDDTTVDPGGPCLNCSYGSCTVDNEDESCFISCFYSGYFDCRYDKTMSPVCLCRD